MAPKEIVCPMCGFKNPSTAARCASCGARVEALGAADLTEEEEYEKRHQQDSFEWKWAFISFAVYLGLQLVFLVGLDIVIDALDFQGLPGMMVSAVIWFIGGIIVGFISPGKTFIEPAVGALLAVVPTILWLLSIDIIAQLSVLAYIIAGLLGVMVTLFGAFLGEKIQMATRGHAKA
jgi:DNA-directed RNA polymerase subunit RPC12/RpoP